MESLKVALVFNHVEKSIQVADQLKHLLVTSGNQIDQDNPDIVISIGGDGTLLSAFHLYSHKLDQVRFLGVHTGHLGFYTDWRDYELEELVDTLCNNQEANVSYPLLDIVIQYRDDRADKHFLALNESSIKSIHRTMVGEVFMKEQFFESFRGDGLSVSTPTGSTAYNKSIGGAVLHPSIEAIQLAEIASLNNRVFRTIGSPIVVSKEDWIEIKLPQGSECLITIDQFNIQQEEVASVIYRVAEEKIRFASYRHMDFWHRVREAFIGEHQRRNEI
ncbi:NAD kinase [Enterococcus lemanii]|uniref:NAD kinase n=1 Tax=Enterococcus lemanii TaxID=1159752 RepID=A0ABV9MZ65_9ENTE|nr:NAD kinase [Enterococcus lemanii]MBM7709997.1 NAD+ kinase [Enterococcus lemanii]